MNAEGRRSLPPASSRVLEGTLTRIHRLREEIEGLERDHEERDDLAGTKVLLESLRALTYEIERKVVDRARQLYDQKDSEAANASFRHRIGGLLQALEIFLPEPVEVARQPFGTEIEALVSPFADIARTISSGRELIFVPADEYEFYDTLKDGLIGFADNYSVRLAKTFRALPELTVITYPRCLDGDVLLHAVIAHEIAHLALERPRPEDGEPVGRTLIGASIDDNYEELKADIESQLDEDADEIEFDRLERSVRSRITQWFDELACDHLAVHMVGPAYLFALFDLEQPSDRWAQGRRMPGYETHPGLAWRVRHLLPLARSFFEADPGRGTPAFEAGRRALDEMESLVPIGEEDEISETERRILEEALVQIARPEYTEAALPLPADYLRKGTLTDEIDLVWAKLEAGIPPSERIRARSTPEVKAIEPSDSWSLPMDWRSILNGAFVYWLAGRSRTLEKDDWQRAMPLSPQAVPDWCDFNAHVRGTVELAVIQAQTIEVRDRLQRINLPGGS